jgi:hypothetical protein
MALVNESKSRSKFEPALSCGECGNSELFVEIMSHESHLIDGKLNYLHLLDSVCRSLFVPPVRQHRRSSVVHHRLQ